MSKEQQLLKYAASGDNSKVENILKGRTNRLKRWLSKDLLDDVPEESEATQPDRQLKRQPSLPSLIDKEKSSHVNVNCKDQNGATPLILASLNGHKDIVYNLISFSANIHLKDKQGNTALHMSAWQNRSEIVDQLLLNGASPIAANKEGNTPLHYACQYCTPGKTLTIIKLLQYESSVLITNNAGETPIDIAISYNKQEAVAILADADPSALESRRIIIEAAIKGRTKIIEILLEAGMDPNSFDTETGKMPLHESVRFFRKDAAHVLLNFGAQPGMRNGDGESVADIITNHPPHRQNDFFDLLKQFKGKKPRLARALSVENVAEEDDGGRISFVHKLLRNRKCWLKNNSKFCSCPSKTNPVYNIFEADPNSYWLIPAPGAYNWVAFDFGSEYVLTGLRIHGWGNKQMIYNFSIDTAPSLSGPWTSVGKYKADLIGPDDLSLPPEGQDFKGFYGKSQFWRLIIADNYGAPETTVASIQFYGYEVAMMDWFKELKLRHHIKPLAENGFNQLSEIAIITDSQLKPLIKSHIERTRIIENAKSLRSKYYPPSNFAWATPPQTKVIENKTMPDFSIVSDPYTVGEVIVILHDGGQILGKNRVQLVSKDNGYLSRAQFTNLSFAPVGTYTMEIHSASDPNVSITLDQPIEVLPTAKRHSEIDRVFADFENMMNFDI
jgi:ankyrin repeat protein